MKKNQCIICFRTKDIPEVCTAVHVLLRGFMWFGKFAVLVLYGTQYPPESAVQYGMWDNLVLNF